MFNTRPLSESSLRSLGKDVYLNRPARSKLQNSVCRQSPKLDLRKNILTAGSTTTSWCVPTVKTLCDHQLTDNLCGSPKRSCNPLHFSSESVQRRVRGQCFYEWHSLILRLGDLDFLRFYWLRKYVYGAVPAGIIDHSATSTFYSTILWNSVLKYCGYLSVKKKKINWGCCNLLSGVFLL